MVPSETLLSAEDFPGSEKLIANPLSCGGTLVNNGSSLSHGSGRPYQPERTSLGVPVWYEGTVLRCPASAATHLSFIVMRRKKSSGRNSTQLGI
ncbi:unnamed protein product [Chondrus crispus]|uniref:Uncharacterized protein n=1 Tax=Chondrus crispus TaxID=2769 RepID=R7QHQ7_CHOCR|nr:unnamed protein product [Chondrus crispus]CDF36955.1 unnamed protein product [Chondrus crispus]|eukprot:XP_005716774.1 unnamed protein product [Chondrus crispus]